MLRSDRLSSAARECGKSLVIAGGERLTGAVRGRKKSLVYVGAALALAGAGSASAATVGSSAPAPVVAATHSIPAARPGTGHGMSAAARPAAGSVTAAKATVRAVKGHSSSSRSASRRSGAHRARVMSWKQVRDQINRQTNPAAASRGKLPLADRLMPVSTSGPQAWMPISGAQLSNATTIVRRALHKRMGIRSAVVAVATSMQESRLLNLGYGDLDSLGLFQQRPSSGWGSPHQILDPVYAADAFLKALRQHQAGDPIWARQPLWANAQAVQNSGFPFAYAKWEAQAAQLVKQIAVKQIATRLH